MDPVDATTGDQHRQQAWERLHPLRPDHCSGSAPEESSASQGSPDEGDRLFEQLFQVCGDGLMLYELTPAAVGGRFLHVNEALCRLLGYPREELMRLSPVELIEDEDKARVPKLIAQVEPSGSTLFEMTLIQKDGGRLPVEVHASAIPFGGRRLAFSVVRDITQRRHAEQALKEREQHWRRAVEGELQKHSQMLEAFFQHTMTPLVFLDRRFNFVRVNEAYARAQGKAPAYFEGRNYFALYPDEGTRSIFEQVVQTRRSYEAHARPLGRPSDPTQVTYWDWELTPLLDPLGEVQCLVFNLEDVTPRQRAFDELEQRARQLEKLTLELSQAEDHERKRVSDILHDDVQQVLAAARFHLGLLGGRGHEEVNQQQTIGEIKQMLRDAIEKCRSLSHELSPAVLHQSSLGETFHWLAGQMEAKHGLAVRIETRGVVDSPSESLRTFLYKAAQELLFNVVKHAGTQQARLRLRRVRGRLCMTISDQGQGFDPRRLAPTAGFGLLNVRERVELLGGRMKIHSAVGRGSTLRIAVPDAHAPPAEPVGPKE